MTIEELKGETVGRLPGTINGTEFIIRNCEVKKSVFLIHLIVFFFFFVFFSNYPAKIRAAVNFPLI